MQIVIDIDENVFTRLFDNGIEDYAIVNDDLFTIAKSIRNCIPLPKGHGRIGDLTKLYNKIDKRNRENGKGKYTGILVLVDNAETIIEADKEE